MKTNYLIKLFVAASLGEQANYIQNNSHQLCNPYSQLVDWNKQKLASINKKVVNTHYFDTSILSERIARTFHSNTETNHKEQMMLIKVVKSDQPRALVNIPA